MVIKKGILIMSKCVKQAEAGKLARYHWQNLKNLLHT